MTTTIEYALMAGNAYQLTTVAAVDRTPMPFGWTQLPGTLGHTTGSMGFEATAYRAGNEIVIAFAGTDPFSLVDWITNIALGFGLESLDGQLKKAAEFYEAIKNDPSCQGANITFTGHSLGGGIASLMGVLFNRQAVTFDEAPFRLKATDKTKTELQAYLQSLPAHYKDQDLDSFSSSTTWNPITENTRRCDEHPRGGKCNGVCGGE